MVDQYLILEARFQPDRLKLGNKIMTGIQSYFRPTVNVVAFFYRRKRIIYITRTTLFPLFRMINKRRPTIFHVLILAMTFTFLQGTSKKEGRGWACEFAREKRRGI